MKYNGSCLTSAISLYSYATLRIRDDSKIIINSLNPNSKLKFKNINEINYNGKLDLVKGVIKILKPEFGFDLEINSDFPLSSGSGGSSSFNFFNNWSV